MSKERLDMLLAQRGLAESREQAQRLVRAGRVLVRQQPATKPGHRYDQDVPIRVKEAARFVGRGGDKLEGAFSSLRLDVSGQTCLDVGASTGGFTDCLLQHGAGKVLAVDVGRGQLHWKLRNDPRVHVLEGLNARYLKAGDLPRKADCAVIDVSFISLTKILPAVIQVLVPSAEIVALVKPQFEAGRRRVGKGGVVTDPAVHRDVLDRIRSFAEGESGLEYLGMCESPLRGPAGNVEFFIHWQRR
jgi:23S rRNA (cytidine1920-2'-O)/16S rRNA (cytidine1409-2'-O)-methyltransferase